MSERRQRQSRIARWWLTLAAALCLTACAGVQPQTPAQALALADSQVTAVIQTAADMREQGALPDAQYHSALDAAEQASAALEMGWTALGNDKPDDALGYISIANKLLIQIRNALEAEQ